MIRAAADRAISRAESSQFLPLRPCHASGPGLRPRGRPAGLHRHRPAVNLVSRLEGLCRPLGRSVLISGAVAAETTTPLVPLGEHVLRGIAAPCAVFALPDA
jgi:class 3 adenylate cyclase